LVLGGHLIVFPSSPLPPKTRCTLAGKPEWPVVGAPPRAAVGLCFHRRAHVGADWATWANWARSFPDRQTGRGQIPRGTPPIPCGRACVTFVLCDSIGRFLFPEIHFDLNPYKSVPTSKIHRKLSITQKITNQSSFESFLIRLHSGLVKYVSLLIISFLGLK
jgi:hypothetical protein